MKKAIATLLIILILLNICIPYSRADDSDDVDGSKAVTQESVDGYMNDGSGKLPTNTGEKNQIPLDTKGNNMNGLITALLEILIVPPMIVNWLMSLAVTSGQSTYTIHDMLLNKYSLFDINFFNVADDSEDSNQNQMNMLKENVAIWYYSIRNISLVGSALIIIYVAIRIALELTRRIKRTRSYC